MVNVLNVPIIAVWANMRHYVHKQDKQHVPQMFVHVPMANSKWAVIVVHIMLRNVLHVTPGLFFITIRALHVHVTMAHLKIALLAVSTIVIQTVKVILAAAGNANIVIHVTADIIW